MNIYILEPGMKVSKSGGKLEVKKDNELIAQYPFEKVENVTLNTNCQITSQCIEKLLNQNVFLSWITSTGKLIGTLVDPMQVDIDKHKHQFHMAEDSSFCLVLAPKFITGKINNQRVLLKRCNRVEKIDAVDKIDITLKLSLKKIEAVVSLDELRGIEGYAARKYYEGLRYFIPESFHFDKRTQQPPLDSFSSLLGFLYHLLFNDLFRTLYMYGFNPYIGVMHQFKQGHPALVSDLMEEWRSIVVDALAVHLLKSNKITALDFTEGASQGVYLKKEARKIVVYEYEKKVCSKFSYLQKNGFGNSFRSGFLAQVYDFFEILKSKNPEKYNPIMIR